MDRDDAVHAWGCPNDPHPTGAIVACGETRESADCPAARVAEAFFWIDGGPAWVAVSRDQSLAARHQEFLAVQGTNLEKRLSDALDDPAEWPDERAIQLSVAVADYFWAKNMPKLAQKIAEFY
jgi:hypothetical protein